MEELRFCRKLLSGVLEVSFYVNIIKVHIMYNPHFQESVCWEGRVELFQGGVTVFTKKKKKQV